jgi:predicted alpha/beta-fold hydrolase
MTMWGKFGRKRLVPPLRFERWDTPDADHVTIGRLRAAANAPRLVLLHGLEGSERSHYIGGILTQATRRGWGADLLLFRTCDGRSNDARRSYHSGETTDLHMVVQRICREFPRAPLALVGVSLGGNVALKWLGEQAHGLAPAMRVAVAVSAPFDLARSSHRIGHGVSRLYERNFLRSLRRKALIKIEKYPDLASADAVSRARSLRAFDDAFTSVVHGFRDAADYYKRSSSIHFLHSIHIPTLLLSARDDPFHPPDVLDDVRRIAVSNPLLVPEFHDRGGHVGFVEGPSPRRATYYAERRIAAFCEQHFRHPATR